MEEDSAYCFAAGQWTPVADEFWQAWPDGGGYEKAFEATGFKWWMQVGDPDGMVLPMTLAVYTRTKNTPHYMVFVEGAGTDLKWIYAQDLPDVMDLLAKWMPTVQAAAISDTLRQFNDPYGENRQAVELLQRLAGRG